MGQRNVGVRINGTCVERMTPEGKWFTTANIGEPIKEFVWEKNGSVHALTESGNLKYATILNPDSKVGYVAQKMEFESGEDLSSPSDKINKIKKKTPLWKWPFKILWWCVKCLTKILFLGFLLDSADNN